MMKKKFVIYALVTFLVIGLVFLSFLWLRKDEELSRAEFSIETITTTNLNLEGSVSSLEERLASLEKSIEELQGEKERLFSQLVGIKEEKTLLRESLEVAEENINKLESDKQSLEEELSKLRDFYEGIFDGVQPPYKKPNGENISLINNIAATDPTWDELLNFLEEDRTDFRQYNPDAYVCSNFAEDVHNNAEIQNIRSAVVVIYFEENKYDTHALNAFHTSDRGLVFVDCTGDYYIPSESQDSVAYIQEGELYGCVLIKSEIESLEYDHYSKWFPIIRGIIDQYPNYLDRLASYQQNLDSYYVQLREYENLFNAWLYSSSDELLPELLQFYERLTQSGAYLNREYTALNNQYRSLISQLASLDVLGKLNMGVLGTVEKVEMYW